jgi:DNA-binding Xre family transcriptional regulator
MTINNKKLKLVENQHSEKTMANLSKLLKDNDMSQVELAKQLGRDKTTVNRWVKNSREVAWDNAVEIAKVLKCHPVDIIEGGKSEIVLKEKCNWDGRVWNLKKEDQYVIPIPFEYNHKNIRAVLVEARGTPNDGEIWLFDVNGSKKFDKNSVGKICYLEGKKIKPVISLLHPTGDGKLTILNTFNGKVIHAKIDPYDLEIAAPVKVKYDPE